MDEVIPKAKPVEAIFMETAPPKNQSDYEVPDGEQAGGTEDITIVDPEGKTSVLRDVDTLVYNIVAFLKAHCDVPEICHLLNEHKNVALKGNKAKLTCGSLEYNFITLYKDCLHDEISKYSKQSAEFITTLLLQLAHGLHHMHKQGVFLGNFDASHIYLSCNKTNVVIRPDPNSASSESADTRSGQDRDIFQLGVLFYRVLTGGIVLSTADEFELERLGCSDKHTAQDLILKMLNKKINCEKVLKHPFFWSDLQKINFTADAFDSCKDDESARENLDQEANALVKEAGWIEELRLSAQERTDILNKERGKQTKSGNKKTQINKDTLYRLAAGLKSRKSQKVNFTPHFYDAIKKELKPINSVRVKKWGSVLKALQCIPSHGENPPPNQKNSGSEDGKSGEEQVNDDTLEGRGRSDHVVIGSIVLVETPEDQCNKHSFYDLLRFFRNRKAHYWDSNLDIRRCFQDYPCGFWKFFSSRYPEMLCFIYNNQRLFLSLESHTCNITRNKSLPDVHSSS